MRNLRLTEVRGLLQILESRARIIESIKRIEIAIINEMESPTPTSEFIPVMKSVLANLNASLTDINSVIERLKDEGTIKETT